MNIRYINMANQNSNKQLKRMRRESDSESDVVRNFPRFLVIESSDENNPLSKLSPFAIHKGIEGILGSTKSIKRLRSGHILIEVDKATRANNLLKLKELVHVPVVVSPHRSLNTKKGVIRCPDIKDCSDDEILQGLAPQHASALYRVTITKDGIKCPTGTFFLTFDTPNLPNFVKVGYLRVKVEAYIPNPIRCFKCQRYGHFKTNCNRSEACEKCGKEDHNSTDCQGAAFCINCDGSHPANSRTCPKWVQEKNIQKLKVMNNITFNEARKIQQTQNPTHTVNYASAVKQSKQAPTMTSTSVQTDYTWPIDNKVMKLIDKQQKTIQQETNNKINTASQTRPAPTERSRSQSRGSSDRRKNNANAGQLSTKNKIPAKQGKDKEKMKQQSSRLQKGSADPLFMHNKYELLDDEGEDMDFRVPDSLPSQKNNTSKIHKGNKVPTNTNKL
jgi:hypothetical protein